MRNIARSVTYTPRNMASDSWDFTSDDPTAPIDRLTLVEKWDLTDEDPYAPIDQPSLGNEVENG
jgi:hypothetical protein